MTTPLKKLARLVRISGVDYVVELTTAGIAFRRPGHRVRTSAPWKSVQQLTERLAGEELHREQLRDQALKRLGRR